MDSRKGLWPRWMARMVTAFVGCHLTLVVATAQGIPVIRNYTAAEYGAHNQNFDIETGDDGTVYVANFEGVLYYDRAQWRILHTPSIHRITVVYKAEDGVVWVGGYNYFGQIRVKSNGELCLERVGQTGVFNGEIQEIFEDEGKVMFLAGDQNVYEVNDGRISFLRRTNAVFESTFSPNLADVESLKKGGEVTILKETLQKEPLSHGLQAIVKHNQGLTIADEDGRTLYSITEENGLCSNGVTYVAYDGHGVLWGATVHGLFAIELPSPYSLFLPKEGLTGEVHTIVEWEGRMYVGTSTGIFRKEGMRFVLLEGFDFCCWKLLPTRDGLLAATANGVFMLTAGKASRQLTTNLSMELLIDGHGVYVGEQDAVYYYDALGGAKKVSDIRQVIKMSKDTKGNIWFQNLYGEVYWKQAGKDGLLPYEADAASQLAATIVPVGSDVKVVSAIATEPFPYPTFSTIDRQGVTWLTDNEGKHLYRWKDGKRLADLDSLLFPFSEMAVSALYIKNQEVWIGGDNMLAVVNVGRKELARLTERSHLLFRSIILGADSVLWGGYGEQPKTLPTLSSSERSLRFVYALEHAPLVGSTLYRYRLNDGKWSAWTNRHDAQFVNLSYGTYELAVQARMANGQLSEVATVEFTIAYPFYMRWYMVVLYFILFLMLVFAFFRLRLKKLRQDKLKLEKTVQERTSEIIKQKDEIEEKSKSLEKALGDLNNAQHELIRQEKMATVGKLTQGLIDRILNPLNYINNFSKLSEGLIKDVQANIEDDKDKMDAENYEDTIDILDMLRGNLQKVSEHGQNTTRTLKAMEEMLKDRTAGYVDMDLQPILRQDEEMLRNYYAGDIAKYHIGVSFNVPDKKLLLHGNPELLSRVLMSMLGNAVYAVVKKAQRTTFEGSISLTLTEDADWYTLKIRDNGIGIEKTIIDKVFDPFFTTKTTGEAAGVGLYLSREIIQNHGGDISVESIKDEHATFTIMLPKVKMREKGNGGERET